MNRYTMENEEASTSTAAKKLKSGEDLEFEVNASFGYRLINFVSVFAAISEAVKCKSCGGEVNFTETSLRGLGFKLKLNCENCQPVLINSCPLIDSRAYEVNRRIVFAFRLLGIGLAGIDKFCGIMDLPKPIFQSFYDKIVNDIHTAAKSISNMSMKNAVEEAKNIDNAESLTVSGDGTMAPKVLSSGAKIVEIASFIAASIFNDGYTNVLLMMQVLNLTIGPNALRTVEELDTRRVSIANARAQEDSKEARKLKRASQKESEDIFAVVEEPMYGP